MQNLHWFQEQYYDFTSSRSTRSHLYGAGRGSAAAGNSSFRHRVWVGRSPAELVVKSSPGPIGWRQNSHRSKAFSAGAAGFSNCGGNHAEVLPNITRQVSAASTAGTLDRLLSSSRAHFSVLPKTTLHVKGEVAPVAILTSGAEAGGPPIDSVASPKAEHAAGQMARESKTWRTMRHKLLTQWNMRTKTVPSRL